MLLSSDPFTFILTLFHLPWKWLGLGRTRSTSLESEGPRWNPNARNQGGDYLDYIRHQAWGGREESCSVSFSLSITATHGKGSMLLGLKWWLCIWLQPCFTCNFQKRDCNGKALMGSEDQHYSYFFLCTEQEAGQEYIAGELSWAISFSSSAHWEWLKNNYRHAGCRFSLCSHCFCLSIFSNPPIIFFLL